MRYSPEVLKAALTCATTYAPNSRRYVIAYSGGCDSQVLLQSLVQLQIPGISLEAVHIDHGLQAGSSDWATQCLTWAGGLGVPCQVVKIMAQHQPGESPEDAARKARYAALTSLLGPEDLLLTGHHCDDQAETLLLQLLRGSGPLGLSAMGKVVSLARGFLVRPLLGVTRTELEHYAIEQALSWIDDPSNQSMAYDRNFLRHQVTPNLAKRWPSWQRIISRAASHQSEVALLSDDLAKIDFDASIDNTRDIIYVDRILSLADYRQRNLLRYWIRGLNLPLPTSRQLGHIQTDVLNAGSNRMPVVKWPGAEIRRYRNDLYAMTPLLKHDPFKRIVWCTSSDNTVQTPTRLLEVKELISMGFSRDVLDCMPLDIRYRCGDDRVLIKRGGIHQDLKKLFQQAGVPPWLRSRIPLIYQGDKLLAVLGYWRSD